MKLDIPAVDRLADVVADVADQTRHGPAPVMVHRVVIVPDTWLWLSLTLIAAGLCGIAWAMSNDSEGGQRGRR